MNNPAVAPELSPATWDWEKGKKVIVPSVAPQPGTMWQNELYASPDGSRMAAVVRLEDESFTVRVNDTPWESTFEKAWLPRFGPDGRLTALVMLDDEWTVAVDDVAWEERAAFMWNTTFGAGGQVYAAVQIDMRYGLCKEGVLWENLFENANCFALRHDGRKSAAVVQMKSLKQADIDGFSSGIYTVAVDGKPWESTFVNLWTPVFDVRGGERVAAPARLNLYEYTVIVNGEPWPATYNCVWEPAFDPATGAITVPVRQGGRWGIASEAAMYWEPTYFQCWNQQWSNDGKHLWAIVAPQYGKFTVARDNKPWAATFPVVTDLTLSPDGTRAAALANKQNDNFRIVVDGVAWAGEWDMAWKPVFSPDGQHVAALVRKNNCMSIVMDGKPWRETFTQAWSPAFSPDSRSLLIRAVQDGAFIRQVVPLADF